MENTPPGICPGPREPSGATAGQTRLMSRFTEPPNKIDTRDSESYLA